MDDPERVAAAAAKRKKTNAAKRAAKANGQSSPEPAAPMNGDLLGRIRTEVEARIAVIDAERARLERVRDAVTQ